jgi:hypothetical protein
VSVLDREDEGNSRALNKLIREMPATYEITIVVRGKRGTSKWKLGGITREKIFADGYPAVIRRVVEAHEQFVGREDAP